MKKKLYGAAVILGTGMILMSGCGNDTNTQNSVEGTESTETDAFAYNVSDYVTLGEYKNLSVRYPVPTISEEDLKMEIEYLQEDNTEYNEITDRGAQNGDYISIDFDGKIDGEEFDEGSEAGYEFTLGGEEFFGSEDFENNLIEKKTGETFTFAMTIPEDYDEEIGGKEAEFSVTLNSIHEVVVPEYNDEFIKKVTDYDTVEAYEEAAMEELMADAQEMAKSSAGEEALQIAMQNASINGYPESLYEACYSSTLNEYQEYADMFGMELSEFMGDEDEIEEEVVSWVNEILVSQAIAEKEGFEVTEDNYKEDAEALAVDYGYASLDEFVSDYGEIYVRVSLLRARAIDFLFENAKVEEVSEDEYYDDEDLNLEEDAATETLSEEDTE